MKRNIANYSKSQTDKIGNAIIYLSNKYSGKLYKTTLLKLIYLIEESSIKKYGVPFFNIDFKIWKLGPVFTDLYYELTEGLDIYKPYFDLKSNTFGKYIDCDKEFSDDEFSDNDIELMDSILDVHKDTSSDVMVEITHSEDRPWYIQAKSENLLDEDGNLTKSITNESIDFEILLEKDSIQYYLLQASQESKRVFESISQS